MLAKASTHVATGLVLDEWILAFARMTAVFAVGTSRGVNTTGHSAQGDAMTGQEFWGYIHILLLVFWLGGDIGVFINAKIAKTTLYPVETRAALLKTGGITDLFPRYCFALIFPSGLTLVDAMG